jgi:C4-dicarboxylate transporter, DctQ subunit
MFSVVWEVITRYFLGQGTTWVDEVGGHCMRALTFLGAAWLLKNEGHIEMDIITVNLNRGHRLLIKAFTSLLGAIMCFVATWVGTDVAFDRLHRGLHRPTPLEPPDFPLFIVIPLGCLPLFIQFLRRAHRAFNDWRALSADGPTEQPDRAPEGD